MESFRDSWVRFVETEMLPQDAEARRRGHVGHELWRQAGELGFLCVDIPEEWGGAGGDFRHEAVLHEEMARRALSGMSIGVHSIAAHYLLNHGTDDQKRRYLPRLGKGELVGAIAMTEPGAGSDLQAIRTRAERHGNQYAIDGSKTFISNGYLAGLVVVVCKTDASERARGISLMLVETKDCDGFRVGRLLDKIGHKAQDTAELFFDDVLVPADNLLGGVEGQGFMVHPSRCWHQSRARHGGSYGPVKLLLTVVQGARRRMSQGIGSSRARAPPFSSPGPQSRYPRRPRSSVSGPASV